MVEYPILLEKLLEHTRIDATDVKYSHGEIEKLEQALQKAKNLCSEVWIVTL